MSLREDAVTVATVALQVAFPQAMRDPDYAREVAEVAVVAVWGLLGPDYHVADIRTDGWSLQHPIECRPNMLDCRVQHVAAHEWPRPPAPVGKYRADLDDERDQICLSELPS